MLTIDSKGIPRATVAGQAGESGRSTLGDGDDNVPQARQEVKVTLSLKGLETAKANQGDSDIDDSGLPDSIRMLLKMVRKLQQELSEARAQLQALMRDRSLDPEQMLKATATLQSRVVGLTAALNSVNAGLIKAMSGLTPDQALKAAKLLGS